MLRINPWLWAMNRCVYNADAGAGSAPASSAGGASLLAGAASGAQPASPTNPPAAAPPAGDAPAGDAPTNADWLSGLDDAGRQLVSAKGWKAPGDMVKAYGSLEGLLGRDKIALPGKDAKPEDWDAVYARLGRPDKPDAYDLSGFKPPEGVPWDAAAQTAMLPHFHKLGLNNAQVAGLLSAYAETQGAAFNSFSQAAIAQPAKAEATLKTEWGGDYAANIELANRAARTAFGAALPDAVKLQLIDGTYLLDNPLMVRALAALGKGVAEDSDLPGLRGASGGGGGVVTNKADAQAEIARIRAAASSDPNHPYVNRKHPEYRAMQDRMQQLYGLMHGE